MFSSSFGLDHIFCEPDTKPKLSLPFLDASSANQFVKPSKKKNMLQKKKSFINEKKIEMKESFTKSSDMEKANNHHFEDVSGNEKCSKLKESQSNFSHATASFCSLNVDIKNKLKQVINCYPEGIWCSELPELFLKKCHFVLDYREFGYTSLIKMLSELPDVFRCVRPGNGDWLLFDASLPHLIQERKNMLLSKSDISHKVRANIRELLFNFLENSSDSKLELVKIPDLYQKMFHSYLDVQSLGFKDVKSLLDTWEGNSFRMSKISGKIFVLPASKLSAHSPIRFEAVPPVTPENDLFFEIFPKEVVGPGERLPELDLYRHVAVGNVVEVCVADVWSPTKFYLQLEKFTNRLNRLMCDLQRFYNVHLKKYKMPDSTIRPNQVCVGLYGAGSDLPEEWHRAQVIKVINKKTALINFVDFGTVTRIKKSQLRFLHRSFQYFPVQAILAELSGVMPPNEEKIWPMSTKSVFLECLKIPYINAEITDIDFKKPAMSVILQDSFQKPVTNINKKLIQQNLAWEKKSSVPGDFFLLPKEE